jgi:hypothetical protein
MLAALLGRWLGKAPERRDLPNRCPRCGEPIHVAYMKAMACGRCGAPLPIRRRHPSMRPSEGPDRGRDRA